MEGAHRRGSLGQPLGGSGLETGESIHCDELEAVLKLDCLAPSSQLRCKLEMLRNCARARAAGCSLRPGLNVALLRLRRTSCGSRPSRTARRLAGGCPPRSSRTFSRAVSWAGRYRGRCSLGLDLGRPWRWACGPASVTVTRCWGRRVTAIKTFNTSPFATRSGSLSPVWSRSLDRRAIPARRPFLWRQLAHLSCPRKTVK